MVRSIRCEIGIEINADKYLVFTRLSRSVVCLYVSVFLSYIFII